MLGFYLAVLDTAEEKNKFELLYYKYKNLLYNYAYSILNDSYLAEDAVHNAFLSLTKNLNKINGENCNETRSYLIIIIRNVAYAIYNDNKKNRGIDIDNENIIALEDTQEDFEKTDITDRVFEIIKSFDSIYSDALVLKLFYEMNDIEIADVLNISVENARVRVFRGRNKLKQIIAEEGLYDGQRI